MYNRRRGITCINVEAWMMKNMISPLSLYNGNLLHADSLVIRFFQYLKPQTPNMVLKKFFPNEQCNNCPELQASMCRGDTS